MLDELTPGYTTYLSATGGSSSRYSVGLRLVEKGVAREFSGRRFEPIAYDAAKAREPDWIWLPNAIVTGATNETPPVQLLRQTQNLGALRLFVDLYHEQNLAENGGIHWRRIRQSYNRQKVGERGPFVVWGFELTGITTWPDAAFVVPFLTGQFEEIAQADGSKGRRDTGLATFWGAEDILVNGLGLVDLVGHVIEADTDSAEIIHPYAVGNGEADEQELARCAQAVAEALLTEGQVAWAREHGLKLLPASRGLPNVQLVGIARLRYRPHTRVTAEWLARKDEWNLWRERYRKIAERVRPDLQYQGKIKEASM